MDATAVEFFLTAPIGAIKGFPRPSHVFAVPRRFTMNLVDLKSNTDYSKVFCP